MEKKNIIVFSLIILAIVIGYMLRTSENLDDGPTNCKWTDTTGMIHNEGLDNCNLCYNCKNNNTGDIFSRTQCIEVGDNIETNMGFNKFHKYKACADF